jgi:glutamate-1-semialdehyde 2,1-aminomutase
MRANNLSRGQRLYRRAKEIIPAGTQLLSKRPEMFAPDVWPPYYQKAKGCLLTDVDGVTYRDFTTMGIGSCLLGYACDPVDDAVVETIRNGTMSSLNSPLEVELAENLLQIHPWAEATRFTRTGGEAMAVAVRIARAATGRSKVAICGYHGWHDWYLSVNLGNSEGLDGQLLPGLAPNGVPRQLADTAFAFHYNCIDELDVLLSQQGKEIAAIVMEPFRYAQPKDGFLDKVLELAVKHQVVLIFDEITSGWRYALGGIHQRLGTIPHIAVFAKAMSNGYPMGAIIGKNAVMQASEASFISSTYWTEATGPAAAIATIRAMADARILETIRAASQRVAAGLREAAEKQALALECVETEAMVILRFNLGEDANAAKTWYTKRMLEKGYLAGGQFYATAAHTAAEVESFLSAASETLGELALILRSGTLRTELTTPEAHQGFQRLT